MARAEARHAGLGAHVRRHRPLRRSRNDATLSSSTCTSPKIEPEIVFKLKRTTVRGPAMRPAVLERREWLALGFEIIDCVFPDWKFQPADFVGGLRAARGVWSSASRSLCQMRRLLRWSTRSRAFTRAAARATDEMVAEGSGKNSLASPALCLAELASAWPLEARRRDAAGRRLISSGTLTDVAARSPPGDAWIASLSRHASPRR